jgi:hypothetical protein
MATVINHGSVLVHRDSMGARDHSGMYADLMELKPGDTFTATFPAKYSATCARNALTHYCRNKLFYQVESHQHGNVLEITRTK